MERLLDPKSPVLENLVSPIPNYRGINRVEDLLIQDPRGWNVTLVREVSPPHLTQAIFRIQFRPDTQPDTLVWAQEKNGLFKVRSTYRFIKQASYQQQGECSNNNFQQSLWKALWKIRALPRVRVFEWRVCRDNLPSIAKLQLKKIIDEISCPLCNAEEKDITPWCFAHISGPNG